MLFSKWFLLLLFIPAGFVAGLAAFLKRVRAASHAQERISRAAAQAATISRVESQRNSLATGHHLFLISGCCFRYEAKISAAIASSAPSITTVVRLGREVLLLNHHRLILACMLKREHMIHKAKDINLPVLGHS